jgi:hypothetical protein
MEWCARFARAYEYGHNRIKLPSWQLGRFAHAYADLCEVEDWSLGAFHAAWHNGEFEPDSLNCWHRRSWFNAIEKRVA